jgi:chromosome partitioning protein
VRIAVANLKGGVGKTTLAVMLAEVAADRHGKALLVDADPQHSAMSWAEDAAAEDDGLRAVTVSLASTDLPRRLAAIADGYSHVIVDTPPGQLPIVRAAAAAVDVVLVPCQPTLMDLARVSEALAVAGDAGKPAAVVLCRVRTGTRALTGARQALDSAEMPVLEAQIPQREAIAALYGLRPHGAVLEIYAAVLDELEAALTATEGSLPWAT